MSKTTNKFAPEVRERAVRMVLDHEGDHPSRWPAITSIAEKIGCSGHTLLEWVKKAEVNISGERPAKFSVNAPMATSDSGTSFAASSQAPTDRDFLKFAGSSTP